MRRTWLCALVIALTGSACAGLQAGREFPSPDPRQIKADVTDKARLVAMFGEPYQVGIDNGEPTWRWVYVQQSATATITKDLTVRFNANDTVKSYSFTSNFPDDMRKRR